MSTVNNNTQRPPPPPPPPPPAPPPTQQAQQAQQQPGVSQANPAVNAQQPAQQTQQQPYQHPFEKSSYEAASGVDAKQKTNPNAQQPSTSTEPVSAASDVKDDVPDLAATGNKDTTGNKGAKAATNTGDSNAVQQTNSVDCGEAALATVLKRDNPGVSDKDLLNKVKGSQGAGGVSVNHADGTNPQEMGTLAAQQGLKTDAFGNFDAGKLKTHVEGGGQAMILADSNALQNAKDGTNKATGQGNQHWLVVDGSRPGPNGLPVYNVQDPSNNTSYELTSNQLEQAVNAGRAGQSGTGAGLLVYPGSTGNTAQQVQNNVNSASTGTTGDGDGTGYSGSYNSLYGTRGG